MVPNLWSTFHIQNYIYIHYIYIYRFNVHRHFPHKYHRVHGFMISGSWINDSVMGEYAGKPPIPSYWLLNIRIFERRHSCLKERGSMSMMKKSISSIKSSFASLFQLLMCPTKSTALGWFWCPLD